MTGKVGSFDVGAVNIQANDLITDDALDALPPDTVAESTNFTVLRLRRDIFSRSSVGVLFENRSKSAVAGSGSNLAWGADGWFALSSEVGVLGYYAKTQTEGLNGLDASYRGQLTWDADQWGARLDHLLVGEDFNPEIGFARRRGFRQSVVSGRVSPRPRSIPWIRQITLQADIDYVENERSGFVESRDRGGQVRVEFENSDQFGVTFGDTYENLVVDERISGALVPAGRYSFREARGSFTFGPQRPWSGSLSVRRGSYYGGTVTSAGLSQGRLELTPRLSVEPNISFNWIRLPQGRFDQHVAVTRLTYTLTPRMFVSGLVQYNSGSDSFSSDLRLRWEWAPGSELFLVYSEARDTDVLDRWSDLVNRGFVIKVNRLLRL
ncbi:MAG: hypothetical protein EXR91_02290 [Gemmatimonadetes bacterium]|nr:hypothetical protein [Gemmatimonadota bacterium]